MEEWADWQKNYRHGTLVILPPPQIRKKIDEFRQQYDPDSQRICGAHITLTQPFLNPLNDNNIKIIKKIIVGYRSFSIQYGPLNNFLPYPCIYYEIHPAEKILAIRQAIHKTGLCNLDLPHSADFIPHMSITDGHPEPVLAKKIFDELQVLTSGGSFKCSEISMIVPDQNFHFEPVHTLRLRSYS
jgi:2'-5' RNA ligase